MLSLVKGFVLVVTFVAVSFSIAFSQENCQQSINQANDEFDAGRFYSLPALLKNCLDGGFTQEQRFRAYYLLVQAYLILDDDIAAEDSYLKLLRENPEFVPNEKDDPIDIVYLGRKFTTRPRFTPHYLAGLNLSLPQSISQVSTFSSDASLNRTPRIGFQLGAGVDWNMSDNWSLGLEGIFASKSFRGVANNISKSDNLEIIDNSAWLDFPLVLKYSYDSGRWRPFVYGGFALNLLLSSSASLIFNDVIVNNQVRPAEGVDESFTFQRNFLNRSIVLGGGIKYKIGKNYFYADARYMVGLNNLTIPGKNYYNSDGTLATTITTYQYVNDFFRLDNLSLTFGYIRPLYNPRKIKRVKPMGLFKSLFGSKRK
jgi:Outer membrane protein beta-barrel domain